MVLIIVVIIFNSLEGNVVSNLFKFATFTYGPLLGLFAFGILTKYQIKDKYVWMVAVASVAITAIIGSIEPEQLGGYVVGYELLPINGLLTFLGLILIRRK